MKRRWSVLFWSSLASLIGLSWFAAKFGVSLLDIMSVAFLGIIAAAVVAGYAMVRELRAKWPAAAVLICSGPVALEILTSSPNVVSLIRFVGPSYALIVAGTVANVAAAILTLLQPLPAPPPPPPIAPARVVE